MSFNTTDGDFLGEANAAVGVSLNEGQELMVGDGGKPRSNVPWPMPVPLRGMPAVPELPLGLLPGWLGEWAAAVADSVQVPADLPALLGLTVAAAGVGRKFRVHVRSDWSEPTNLYCAVALRTGERKSKVFSLALAPLRALTLKLRQQTKERTDFTKFNRGIMGRQLKRLAKSLTDCSDGEQVEAQLKVADDLLRALAASTPPPCPVLVADDEMLDTLGQLLVEQKGRLLVASPEGTPLEKLRGGNFGRTNVDVYLKAYSGDTIEVGRVGHERDSIDHPALSMVLATKPYLLQRLGKDMTLAQRGFLGRILYSSPNSLVGQRQVGTAQIPKQVALAYKRSILALWSSDYAQSEKKGKEKAHLLRFAPEGAAAMEEFERWLEPKLGICGPLSTLGGWGNKLAGGCARLAGVLHLCASGTDPIVQDIPPSTVETALRLGRDYFLPHARAMFHLMREDPRLPLALRILGWIKKTGLSMFSRRDCHVRFNRSIEKVEALDAPLLLLEKHGWVRQLPQPERSGPGRKSSPVFEVYPEINTVDYDANPDQWDDRTIDE